MDSVDILKDSKTLQEQIQVVKIQRQVRRYLKEKHDDLKAEDNILLEQRNILVDTYSDIYWKLLREEDQRYKWCAEGAHQRLEAQKEELEPQKSEGFEDSMKQKKLKEVTQQPENNRRSITWPR